jgi:hypothetical protein
MVNDQGYPQYRRITENTESVRMIRKMLLTTAEVVASPTPAAPPRTRNPRKQPIQEIRKAKTALFRTPRKTSKGVRVAKV